MAIRIRAYTWQATTRAYHNYNQVRLKKLLMPLSVCMVSVRHGRFMERSGVLPIMAQFANRKGLGNCDTLFLVSHTLQSALESEK